MARLSRSFAILCAAVVPGVLLGGCAAGSGALVSETPAEASSQLTGTAARRAWSELEGRLVTATADVGTAEFKTSYTGSGAAALDVEGLVVTGSLDVTDGLQVGLTLVTPEDIAAGTHSRLVWSNGMSYLSTGPLVDLGLYVAQPVEIPDNAPLGSLYSGVQLADPGGQLDGMAEAVTSFEALGAVDVGQKEVEQYVLELDGALLEGPVTAGLPKGTDDDAVVLARLDVGEGDLLKELELTLPVDGGKSVTVTSEYLRWGYSVDYTVSPPHDDLVMTPEESAELLGWTP